MAKLFFILMVTGALYELLSPAEPPLLIDASRPGAAR